MQKTFKKFDVLFCKFTKILKLHCEKNKGKFVQNVLKKMAEKIGEILWKKLWKKLSKKLSKKLGKKLYKNLAKNCTKIAQKKLFNNFTKKLMNSYFNYSGCHYDKSDFLCIQ